eukprot:TRINITY_DN3326_c0_g1_i3.p1 TRINITY_DN3326_c0_g1~~TRINITY_DN3326_c0_g1_i3.p1  ORF type:complete len:672 (-),score=130.92 TRINITY_DN3326_c0_g1_i3:37-2010(-)
MSHPPLTAGAVATLFRNEHPSTSLKPVLQVLEIKRIQVNNSAPAGQPDRFRLVISDGQHYQQGMLATQLNHMVSLDGNVEGGKVATTCIIRVHEYNINLLSNRKIAFLLNVEVLTPPLGHTIGAPVNIEPTGAQPAPSGSGPVAAAPHAPFTASPYNPPGAFTPHSAPAPAAHGHAPAPAPYGNPPRGVPTRSVGGAGDEDLSHHTVYPIKNINQFQNKFTIKARVTNKSAMRAWNSKQGKGSGELFNVDLLDGEGGEIRATMFNEAAKRFYEVFQVGQVYFIKINGGPGNVKTAQRKFSNIQNEYELTLDQNTVIQPCFDDAGIATVQYHFTVIGELRYANKDAMVDVVGIVSNSQALGSITARNSGQQISRRNITLIDTSGCSIDMTLWSERAEQWDEHIQNPVLAVRGVKVSDYGGKTLSSVGSTSMELNPNIPETTILRQWFDSQHGNVPHMSLSGAGRAGGDQGGNQMGGAGDAARHTLGEAKDRHFGVTGAPSTWSSKATVVRVKREGMLYYDACTTPDCKFKKVVPASGGFSCEKCHMTIERPHRRYTLNICISDNSNDMWATCFNEVGLIIMGVDAETFAHAKENDELASQFEAIIAEATFKSWNFRIRAKEDEYLGDKRVKYAVVHVEPINFVQESRNLLAEIKKYGV